MWFNGCRAVAFLLAAALGLSQSGPAASQDGRVQRRTEAFKIEPQRHGVVDVYILSFGLWGPQSVFESEARGAAEILARQLDARGRTIVRFNTKVRSDARPDTMLAASGAAGHVLDPDEDVIVLVLTSHGSPDGIGLIAGGERLLVTPRDVGILLRASRARYRVVIVSACYSGIFARALADERTLVITAAAPDKPSFGCADGRTWTYFGDAFFNKALRAEPRLDLAFEKAKTLVTARERREGFDPSNPQIAGGREVLERLSQR